jgi:hypothetical protein
MSKPHQRNTLSRRGNQPVAVITVPTLLRPTFAIPIQFDRTTSGDVLLPNQLVGIPFRVTSARFSATAVGGAAGTVTFALSNGTVGSAGFAASSRGFPTHSSPTEINFRNDRHVQHAIGSATTILATFGITTSRVTGVIMVSFIGTYG